MPRHAISLEEAVALTTPAPMVRALASKPAIGLESAVAANVTSAPRPGAISLEQAQALSAPVTPSPVSMPALAPMTRQPPAQPAPNAPRPSLTDRAGLHAKVGFLGVDGPSAGAGSEIYRDSELAPRARQELGVAPAPTTLGQGPSVQKELAALDRRIAQDIDPNIKLRLQARRQKLLGKKKRLETEIGQAQAAQQERDADLLQQYQDMPDARGFAENAAAVIGRIGAAVPQPENILPINRGATVLRGFAKGAAAGSVANLITDAAVQRLATERGAQPGYSPTDAVINTALGALLGGAFNASRHLSLITRVKGWIANRKGVRPNQVTADHVAEATNNAAPELRAKVAEWQGRDTNPIYTGAGSKIETKAELVELESLVSSDMPTFDKALQPRDRAGRAASEVQIREIIGRFDPDRLSAQGTDAASGAPVVLADGTVLSGNGRVMALREIYAGHPERAGQYRAWLEAQGHDVSGMRAPVLVRRNMDQADPDFLRRYAVEANESTAAQMSPTERAQADASALSRDVLEQFEGDDVTAAANVGFVKSYFAKLSPQLRGELQDAGGNLNAAGVSRIKAALMARAYDDADLIGKLVESTDNNIRSVGGGLQGVAAPWAVMRDTVQAGEIKPQYDITDQLVAAARKLSDLRSSGTKIKDYFAQVDPFDTLDDVGKQLLSVFVDPETGLYRGQDKIGVALKGYLNLAGEQTTAPQLIDAAPEIPPADMVRIALRGSMDGDLFAAKDLQGLPTQPAPQRAPPPAELGLEPVSPAKRPRAPAERLAASQFEDSLFDTYSPSTAEATRPRPMGGRLFDRVANRFAGMSPLGALPNKQNYLANRYLTMGRVAKVDEIAREISSAFRGLPKAKARQVYDFLTTKGADPETIADTTTRAAAVRAKETIEKVGQTLVGKGLLSADAYEANRGSYLPRVYLRHLLDTSSGAGGTGNRASASDMSYLKARKDIPKDVREIILGEITDPAYLTGQGIAKPMRDVAVLDFLDLVSRDSAWTLPESFVDWQGQRVTPQWLKAEANRLRKQAKAFLYDSDNADPARALADQMDDTANKVLAGRSEVPTGYMQVPDSPRYGQLRGMHVRKEIHDDIVGAIEFVSGNAPFAQQVLGDGGALAKGVGMWKLSKVALNPPTQFRNFMSNAILMHMSGVRMDQVPVRIGQAIKEIRFGKGTGKHYQIAKKYGVTVSSFTASETFRFNTELSRAMATVGPVKGSWAKTKQYAGAVGNFAGDAYQWSETVMKTASIIDSMARGIPEEEAALNAQRWLFDYSLVPGSVRYLRSAAIGMPFLTFQYKVLPRLLETAMTRPTKFLPYLLIGPAMGAYIASDYDVSQDDLDKLREAFPKWIRNKGHAYILPQKDEHGRWQAIDLSYLFPWGFYSDAAQSLSTGEVGTVARQMPIMASPLVQLAAGIGTNIDPFTQREIRNEADPPSRQAGDMVDWLWRSMAPTWLTDIGAAKHLYRTLTGETDRRGQPRLTLPQAAGRFVGVNVYPIDPAESRRREMRGRDYDIREIKARRNQVLRDKSLSKVERDEWLAEMQQLLRERIREKQMYSLKSSLPAALR